MNTAYYGANPDFTAPGNPGTNLSVHHSLIGRSDGTTLTPTTPPTADGNGNHIGGATAGTAIDPLLGPLAFNGGPTQTHALLAGSLAIDSGSNALAVDPTPAALVNDQRGAPFDRIFNTTVDMGAFERQTVAGLSLIVDNATDENDGDYSAGDLSLREAVGLANGSLGTDTITFADALNGTPLLLDLGDIQVADDLTLTGNGETNTIIDAQENSRIFRVSGVGTDLTLDSLTLKDGRTFSSGGGAISSTATGSSLVEVNNSTISGNFAANAGGVYALYSNVTITNSTLTDNRGGITGAILAANGDVTVTDSTLTENFTTGAYAEGGAISTSSGNIVITQSTLTNNESGRGGGAISTMSGDVTLTGSTISNNDAVLGGGAVISGSGSISIVSSILSGNSTSLLVGGGAIFANSGDVTVTNSTLSGNSATGNNASGGGILNYSGNITVVNSTLSGNSTNGNNAFGGGIASPTTGDVTIVNSTLSGNRVTGTGAHGGGAIYFDDGTLTIVNSTITNNSANIGGGIGIYNDNAGEALTVHNSIIAGNTAATNPDFTAPGDPGTNLRVRNSLVGDNTGTTLAADPNAMTVNNTVQMNSFVGTGGAPINPMLAPLAFNGGPTQTHALLPGSLAIDSGSNALAVDPTPNALAHDQRGAPLHPHRQHHRRHGRL